MKTYFQVCPSFSLSAGKPQLESVTLHSTIAYCPFLVGSFTSYLSHSRFFHTVKEAHNYITYLFSRYPTSTATYPILDSDQLLLF
jgi:hypothetical protein